MLAANAENNTAIAEKKTEKAKENNAFWSKNVRHCWRVLCNIVLIDENIGGVTVLFYIKWETNRAGFI